MDPNARPLLYTGNPYTNGLPSTGLPPYYPQPFSMLPSVTMPSVLPPPPQPQHKQLEPHHVQLVVKQEPKEGLVASVGKEKSRKSLDPPPVIQLFVTGDVDPNQHFMSSPYLFMTASLWDENATNPVTMGDTSKKESSLCGSVVSSLHKLKYPGNDNREGAFFVFGELSVRIVGRHRLRFNLYDIRKESNEVVSLGHVYSESFAIVQQKDYRGVEESTNLSRAFAEQGVRLRLKKEPRGYNSNKRSYGSFSGQPRFSQEDSPPEMKHEGATTEYAQEYCHEHNGHNVHNGQYHDPKRVRGQGFFDGLAGPMPTSSAYSSYAGGLAVRSPETPYTLEPNLTNVTSTSLPYLPNYAVSNELPLSFQFQEQDLGQNMLPLPQTNGHTDNIHPALMSTMLPMPHSHTNGHQSNLYFDPTRKYEARVEGEDDVPDATK